MRYFQLPSAPMVNESPVGIDNGIIQLRSMDKGEFELPVSLKIPKPYEGMNITSVVGLTEDQRRNLRSLGAIEVKQT